MTPRQGAKARCKAGIHVPLLLYLSVIFLTFAPAPHSQTLDSRPASRVPFILTVQDDLISLRANNASIKAIVEEIGRQMNIQVKSEIPAAAKVTLAFDRLPLPEVLRRLGKYVNYGYVERGEQEGGQISAITIHSLKGEAFLTQPGAEVSRQAPPAKALELEIDPRQFLKPKR